MPDAVRCFAASLAFFHASEFCVACVYNWRDVGWHSFLFSWPYTAAMSFACAEYLTEQALLPGLKASPHAASVQRAGLALLLLGEALRKCALLTAKQSFTHVIATWHRPQHMLVTCGVYRLMRHPGYLGWLLWAVGTQVLLQNLVSAVLFAALSWRFFSRRIPFEEARLREFFGEEYARYAERTPTYIPFIH